MIDINTEELRCTTDGKFFFLADAIKTRAVQELINSRGSHIRKLEAKVSTLESELASARSLHKLDTAFIDEVVEEFQVPEGEMPGTYIREHLRKLSEHIAELEVRVSTLSPSDPDIYKKPLNIIVDNGYVWTFQVALESDEYGISLQDSGGFSQSFWFTRDQLAEALPYITAFVMAHKKGESS